MEGAGFPDSRLRGKDGSTRDIRIPGLLKGEGRPPAGGG